MRCLRDLPHHVRVSRVSCAQPMPWEVFERRERASRPFKIFEMRNMLRVPYFEKVGSASGWGKVEEGRKSGRTVQVDANERKHPFTQWLLFV